jgi:hypothetical protein
MTDAVLRNALMQAPTPRLIRVLQAFGSQHAVLSKECQASRERAKLMAQTAAILVKTSTRLALNLEKSHEISNSPATTTQTAQLAQAREQILESRKLVRSTQQELLRDIVQRNQAESLVATSLSPVRSSDSFAGLGIQFMAVKQLIQSALSEESTTVRSPEKLTVRLKGIRVLDAMWMILSRSLPSRRDGFHDGGVSTGDDSNPSTSEQRRFRRGVARVRQAIAGRLIVADVLQLGSNSETNGKDERDTCLTTPSIKVPEMYLTRVLDMIRAASATHEKDAYEHKESSCQEINMTWAWGVLACIVRLHSALGSWTLGRRYINTRADDVVDLLLSTLTIALNPDSNTHISTTAVLIKYSAQWAAIALQKLSTGLQVGDQLYPVWRTTASRAADFLQDTHSHTLLDTNALQYMSSMLCNVCAAVAREHVQGNADENEGQVGDREQWMVDTASKCVSLVEVTWNKATMHASQHHIISAVFALVSSERCRVEAEQHQWHVRLATLLDVDCGGESNSLEVSEVATSKSRSDVMAAKHALQCVVDALKGDKALLGAAKAASTMGKQESRANDDQQQPDAMVVDADVLSDLFSGVSAGKDDAGAEVLDIVIGAFQMRDALSTERGEALLRSLDLMDPNEYRST